MIFMFHLHDINILRELFRWERVPLNTKCEALVFYGLYRAYHLYPSGATNVWETTDIETGLFLEAVIKEYNDRSNEEGGDQ